MTEREQKAEGDQELAYVDLVAHPELEPDLGPTRESIEQCAEPPDALYVDRSGTGGMLMSPFFEAVEARNELVEARRELEPTYHEPPWPPSPEEAQAARDLAAAAGVANPGRVAAAEAAWAQVRARYPSAAALVEAEAEAAGREAEAE